MYPACGAILVPCGMARALLALCRQAAFWCACLLACGHTAAAQVAMMTDLQGKATLHGASGPSALDVLSELQAGEEIVLADGARATVTYLRTGDEYLVSGPARVAVGAEQLLARSGGAIQRRASPLAAAAKRFVAGGGVIQAAVRMRSGPDSVGPVEPRGKLLAPPARFAWRGVPPGAVSAFELAQEGGTAPIVSLDAQGSELSLPRNVTLAVGRPYVWVLSFRDAGGRRRSLESAFELAGAAEAREWERLRPTADAPVSDWVLYAALLKQAGFDSDAGRIWARIATQRPDSTELGALARP